MNLDYYYNWAAAPNHPFFHQNSYNYNAQPAATNYQPNSQNMLFNNGSFEYLHKHIGQQQQQQSQQQPVAVVAQSGQNGSPYWNGAAYVQQPQPSQPPPPPPPPQPPNVFAMQMPMPIQGTPGVQQVGSNNNGQHTQFMPPSATPFEPITNSSNNNANKQHAENLNYNMNYFNTFGDRKQNQTVANLAYTDQRPNSNFFANPTLNSKNMNNCKSICGNLRNCF
jgi:hypothetical protein